ncbi:MAG: UDP-N-acetylmuramate dehydrogenase [Candidatus Omnitrophica bacterium]|nr:UDP-N-acetylmuramate dehydrogenase [Candidatus Omnitrophota bacterium]
MNLRTALKTPLRQGVSLSQYSTMQVGGPSRYFASPETEEELFELLDFARREKMPWLVIGKGSNMIFPDEGYAGLVISFLHYEQNKICFDLKEDSVTAGAGIFLYRLVLAARDQGLGGIEFLCNVPGTVGGAVIMNAGFSRFPGQVNEAGDVLAEVEVLGEDGKKERWFKKDLVFSYRQSNLNGKIVLAAKFQLWKRRRKDIEREIRANFDFRNSKQDLRFPSSGSIFKNPPKPLPAAGQLIDRLGLKGKRVGGAVVSEKHANYIINAGGAKSSDIVELIRRIQKLVLDATEVSLETEVRIIEKN